MRKNPYRWPLARFRHSKKALAIPATFLILFVSTLGLISVTYYFAVERVNARGQTLKITTAKQNFVSLDQNIMSVAWQPGSARQFEIADSGGELNVSPQNVSLSVSISDGADLNETVFNQSIGQVCYELPYSGSPETGLFLKGDSRTITNQTGAVVTQLCIASGVEHPEIRLSYRPTVSYASTGIDNNRAVNDLRIYIVNLNSSDAVVLYGKVPLRISCESTQITNTQYILNQSLSQLSINSVIDGEMGQVNVPISSTVDGAIINLEVVQCNIKVERSLL